MGLTRVILAVLVLWSGARYTDSASSGPSGSGSSGSAELTLVDTGSGLSRAVTIEAPGRFRLVFEAGDNWGISQWYDLVGDPGARTNLTGPGYGVSQEITVAEPGLFQEVFYGVTPDDPKLYSRAATYYFPNSPRIFKIVERSAARIIVQAISKPIAGSRGILSNVTADVTYYIYPNGKIYVHSVTSVAAAQSIGEWRSAVLGLEDPTSTVPYSAADTAGWIRASATQNPYSWTDEAEPYLFAYWSPRTPAPYTGFTKASILLVPRPGNPLQGVRSAHNWMGWKRWSYRVSNASLSAGQSIVQDYLIQLGTQGSSILPNLNSSAVADPIANAYRVNPAPP